MAVRIDVDGRRTWNTQPGDEWVSVQEAETRLNSQTDAFMEGVQAVLTIRCSEHVGVPQLNSSTFNGGECGACVQAERRRRQEDEQVRTFVLQRDVDVSGVSGTGVVAWGVEFPDGVVALRWKSDWPTSVVFHDRGMEAVEAVHGHGGSTRIVFGQPAPDARRYGIPGPTPAREEGKRKATCYCGHEYAAHYFFDEKSNCERCLCGGYEETLWPSPSPVEAQGEEWALPSEIRAAIVGMDKSAYISWPTEEPSWYHSWRLLVEYAKKEATHAGE